MALLKNLWDKATKNGSEAAANANVSADPIKAAQLFAAVINNQPATVTALIDSGVPVDARNELGETPLMLAVHRHQVSMVHELLSRKADPNAEADDKLTPLCYASQLAHWDMVGLLVQGGAKSAGTNPKEFMQLNALLLRAIEEKDQEAIAALTQAGVKDAEALRNKVFYLAEKDDARSLEHCLNSGVPANLRDAQGNTLLSKANDAGANKVASLLVDFGADKSAKNKTARVETAPLTPEALQKALQSAVEDGRAPMINRLIQQGADPNLATPNNKPPLCLAMDSSNFACAAALINAGANPGAIIQNNLFDFCVGIIRSGDVNAVGRLLDSSVATDLNVGTQAGKRFSLLHVAAEHDAAMAKVVLQHFPGLVNRKEQWAFSPLRMGLIKNNLSVVQALLDAGADPRIPGKMPNGQRETDTEFAVAHCSGPIVDAMTAAAQKFEWMDSGARGDLDAVKQAMQAGVPADLTDASGKTVLFVACQRGYTEIAQLLLAHGASATRPGPDGSTPMSAAVASGDADIVRALGDAGASVMTPDSRGVAPVIYLEEGSSVRQEMREAITYCRDLDIVRMSQHATTLENKTSVLKKLRFKTAAPA